MRWARSYRTIVKPSSLLALSVQCSRTRLELIASAVKPVGAAGRDRPAGGLLPVPGGRRGAWGVPVGLAEDDGSLVVAPSGLAVPSEGPDASVDAAVGVSAWLAPAVGVVPDEA